MDHKEQIVVYLFAKIRELTEKIKKNEIEKKEIITQLEMFEDMLRDYFNFSD